MRDWEGCVGAVDAREASFLFLILLLFLGLGLGLGKERDGVLIIVVLQGEGVAWVDVDCTSDRDVSVVCGLDIRGSGVEEGVGWWDWGGRRGICRANM